MEVSRRALRCIFLLQQLPCSVLICWHISRRRRDVVVSSWKPPSNPHYCSTYVPVVAFPFVIINFSTESVWCASTPVSERVKKYFFCVSGGVVCLRLLPATVICWCSKRLSKVIVLSADVFS